MGMIRFLLALAVVFQHLGQPFHKSFVDAGMAVYLFFILSGFYITLVLRTRYKSVSPWQFYISRYVRLFPLFIIGNLILFFAGAQLENSELINQWHALSFLQKLIVVIPNITLFGCEILSSLRIEGSGTFFSQFDIDPLHNGTKYLLNPPSWTLSVELLFYLLAPFIVFSVYRIGAFFLVGVIYYVFTIYDPNFSHQYRIDMFLPYYVPYFAMGIFSYLLYENWQKYVQTNWFYPVAIGLSLIVLYIPLHLNSMVYLFFAFAILILFPMTKGNRFDRILGDMSYPIYILHLPVHALILLYLPGVSVAGCYLIIILISIAAVFFVDRRLEKIRYRLAHVSSQRIE